MLVLDEDYFMKQLEKWYLWDKKSIIKGVHRVLMSNGINASLRGGSPLGEVSSDFSTFVAYTLGEKVESKRKCLHCNGEGVVNTKSFADMRNIFVQCQCKRGNDDN